MAKFCTECGKEIAPGVAFCTECGTKVPADPVPQTPDPVPQTPEPIPQTPEPVTERSVEPAVEAPPEPVAPAEIPPETQPEDPSPQVLAQTDPPPAPPQPPQPPPKPADPAPAPVVNPATKVVGLGAFFGLIFLFSIPIVGLIACIIMAFAPKNKNLKNYARAMLIWTVIGLIIAGLLFALIYALTNVIMGYVGQLTEGLTGESGIFGGLFDQFGDIMKDFGNLKEQFDGGGFSDLPMD